MSFESRKRLNDLWIYLLSKDVSPIYSKSNKIYSKSNKIKPLLIDLFFYLKNKNRMNEGDESLIYYIT